MKSWIRWDVVLVIMASACSNGSDNGLGGSSPGSSENSGSGGSGSFSGSSGGSGAGTLSPAVDAGLPPETKTESAFESPVATGNIVWIANPTSGLVAYIDSSTFSVQTVAAGDAPTYLAAIPSTTGDVAIVQNALSHDATLLDDRSGVLTPTTFPSTVDANSWAVSTQDPANASETNARWAIAWTDATRISNPDPTQGFQEIAIFDLSGGSAARAPQILTVGYRPSQFAFSADESTAYAVTEDGISVIDLVGGPAPRVTANLPLQVSGSSSEGSGDAAAGDMTPDANITGGSAPDASEPDAGPPDASLSDATVADASTPDASAATPDAAPIGPSSVGTSSTSPSAPDVSFRPDGSMALVRLDGSNVISVIALPSGTTTSVVLPSAPTDLTIAPSGDFAVAVLRDASTVVILPLPGIASDPGSFSLVPVAGTTIGRAIVTKSGSSILLFTTAAPVDAMVVMTATSPHGYRVVTLHEPVLAVFPTNDEQNAVVLHNVTPVAGSNVKGAFSLVPVATSLPASIQSLTAPPTAVAIDDASDRALITLRDDTTGTYGVDLALFPSLQVVPFSLASPPIAAGIVGGEGYAAQDFDEGRITFIDLGTQAERTITGFDLGARIVTGGDQ
jgi:hypothetical protein